MIAANSVSISCRDLSSRIESLNPALVHHSLTALALLLDGVSVRVGGTILSTWPGISQPNEPPFELVVTRVTTSGTTSGSFGVSSAASPLRSSNAASTLYQINLKTRILFEKEGTMISKLPLSPWKLNAPLEYISPSSPRTPTTPLTISTNITPISKTPLELVAAEPTSVTTKEVRLLSIRDVALLMRGEGGRGEDLKRGDSKEDDTSEVGNGKQSFRPAVAGLDEPLNTLREVLLLPLIQQFAEDPFVVETPRGVLLFGPPGCGKTALVRAVADEAENVLFKLRLMVMETNSSSAFQSGSVKIFSVLGPEALSGSAIGESERRLREIFRAADAHADKSRMNLSIIFLDEVDALCPKRAYKGARAADTGTNSPTVARLVTQLLVLMDGLGTKVARASGRVVVIGATNRPNSIDLALRRPGRLEKEIRISHPSANARLEILKLHTFNSTLSSQAIGFLPTLAGSLLSGFVGADIETLCREADTEAKSREKKGYKGDKDGQYNSDLQKEIEIEPQDFLSALNRVGPSTLRGLTTSISSYSVDDTSNQSLDPWANIGGMGITINKLKEVVQFPMQKRLNKDKNKVDQDLAYSPSLYARFKVSMPRGILLHGPPGNSKTTIARALAVSIGCGPSRFFALSGADVFSAYVGESERTLRDLFALAREAAPSVIFLDEIDAMVGGRGSSQDGRSESASGGILTTLLTEIDGMHATSGDGVIVIAATNRVEVLDPALLRPGRLELLIQVNPPEGVDAIEEVLQIHTSHMPLSDDVSLRQIAEAIDAYSKRPGGRQASGADIAGLCVEAAMETLRENLKSKTSQVTTAHFLSAAAAMMK